MIFNATKVVSTLPGTLAPNTIILVRVGAGFDLYCSDATGAVAHKLNQVSVTDSTEIDLTLTGQQISASLVNTNVAPGSYGSGNSVPTFTVDAKGRLTAVNNAAIAINQSAVAGLVTDLTASSLLTKLLTVDGSGSGLDADLLDGLNTGTTGTDYIPFVNSSGFLGIGNTSPVAPLTIGTKQAGEPTYNGDFVINQSGALGGVNATGGLAFKIDGTLSGYGVRLFQWFNGNNAYNFSIQNRHNSAEWATALTVTHLRKVGVGTTTPTERLEVAGNIKANGNFVTERVAVPATATSAGTTGQIAFNSTHFYCCTATNTWVRSALATW